MSLPNHSIHPVSSCDLAFLSEFVHTQKLALPINRLLFKAWPNDAAQKPLYAGAVESAFRDSSVECLKMVDDHAGDIVGYLALSRKRGVQRTEQADSDQSDEQRHGGGKDRRQQQQQQQSPNIPEFFNSEVLDAISKATTELAEEFEGIDHFGEPEFPFLPRYFFTRTLSFAFLHVSIK